VDEYGSRRNRRSDVLDLGASGPVSRVSIIWFGTGAEDIYVGGNGIAGRRGWGTVLGYGIV
jgi:hypothetical protein